jgi:hypothetical protein
MSTELTTRNPDIIDVGPAEISTTGLILDNNSMDSMVRMAELMAGGRATIPVHLQKNTSDCLAVVSQAMQWRMNPFAVAQKTHVVNGALGYEAQLVNAVIQSSGVTLGRFVYEWFGPWEAIIGKTKVIDMPAKEGKKAYQFRVPDYDMRAENGCGIRVSATLKGESEPRVLELLLVQASVRNSPLWATDPKQQLAYLAVKRWTRLFAPDVILGVYTPDELEEIRREPIDVTPRASTPAQLAQASVAAAPELTDNQKQLIVDLEEVARTQGAQALADNWGKLLTKADRKAIGAAQLDRLKAIAQNADDDRAIAAADAAAEAAASTTDDTAQATADVADTAAATGDTGTQDQ